MLRTMRDKLDYLTRVTGRSESEIVVEAIEEGLTELYRKYIVDSYLSGELERKIATTKLGEEIVEELDYAKSSVEKDIRWGLKACFDKLFNNSTLYLSKGLYNYTQKLLDDLIKR